MIALMRRRSFLAAPLAAYPVAAYPLAAAESEPRVYAFGDGIRHTPAEYAKLLTTLTNSGNLTVDDYSRGGVVEQLEVRVAAMLGKEAAVWLPTGTLARSGRA
jgi:threonine aldolase